METLRSLACMHACGVEVVVSWDLEDFNNKGTSSALLQFRLFITVQFPEDFCAAPRRVLLPHSNPEYQYSDFSTPFNSSPARVPCQSKQ